MKEEIRDFLKEKNRKVLLIEHKGDVNVLYRWSSIRNPLRMIINALIIRICKDMPLRLKVHLLRMIGMKIGKNVGIALGTEFDPSYPELISIEDNAIIGWKVNILCHEFTKDHIRLGRVHIGKNVLVGAFSSLRSGISINDNSVLAMDSLANKDIPSSELWGGVPAKRIRKLNRRT